MKDTTDAQLRSARREVVAVAQRMTAEGLVVGTSGNVSTRVGDLVCATPSGVDYATMTEDDVPVVTLDGTVVHGHLKPTSELPMHLRCYTDFGAAAVVHTHSTAATALSLLRSEVPLVHYQTAMFGGRVRVAPYATFGTPELADAMAAALQERSACVLAHHGTITFSHSLSHAYDKARQLEWLCDVWLRASSAGLPRELTDADLAVVLEKFGSYGQVRPRSAAPHLSRRGGPPASSAAEPSRPYSPTHPLPAASAVSCPLPDEEETNEQHP